MKKMLLILGVLAVAASVHAQGIDTSKWLIANDISNGLDQCNFASQTSQAGGYGILTFNYMYEGYSCPGSEGVDFAGGFIITRPFSFTYGVVEARISLGTDEDPLYGAVWMWGGDPTSSGYPPTCTATIAAGIGDTMANCTSTAVNAYEFDICESFLTLDSVGGNSHVWQNANVVLTGGGFHTGSDLATFHVCRLEWSPTAVTWKYDGVVEGTESIVLPPSDVKMAIIIDQEKWDTPPIYTPDNTLIDYVRVCSDPTAVCAYGDPTMIFDDEFGSTPVPSPTVLQGVKAQGIAIQ